MKKLILFSALILTAAVTQAATAPGYNSLRKMDAAIAALAKGGGKTNLAPRNEGDVTVARASMTQNKTTGGEVISIDVANLICSLAIKAKPAPKGMVGATSYTARVIVCNRYMTVKAVDVMKYEDVRPVLEKAASKGKTNLSFRVQATPQGNKVKLAAE